MCAAHNYLTILPETTPVPHFTDNFLHPTTQVYIFVLSKNHFVLKFHLLVDFLIFLYVFQVFFETVQFNLRNLTKTNKPIWGRDSKKGWRMYSHCHIDKSTQTLPCLDQSTIKEFHFIWNLNSIPPIAGPEESQLEFQQFFNVENSHS